MTKHFLVPALLAALTTAAWAQSASGSANAPGSTMANGAMNSAGPSIAPGSAPKGSTQPRLAEPRRSAAMTSRATGSIAPGSAPKGSDAPQMAKPGPGETKGASIGKR